MKNGASNKIYFKQYNPFLDFDSVETIWKSLLKRCPHTYFLSWAWKKLWLESLPTDCNLFFIAGFIDETPVLAFFFSLNVAKQHKFIHVRRISINSTQIPEIDELYFEYDGIIIDPEITISLEELLESIPMQWDELHLPKCTSIYNPGLQLYGCIIKGYDIQTKSGVSYYVNLEKVRQMNNDYLAMLSGNRRQKIRRSIKEYEKLGELRMAVAENVNVALEFFDELNQLHQQLWQERGQPGIFSNKYVVEFHKSLISRRFEHGEIQLVKVSAGSHTIGCLYNLIYDGKVITYIWGFNYLQQGHLFVPGYVTHYLSIVHNAIAGLSSYDFCAGESPHKITLSSDYNEMRDVIVWRKSTKFTIVKLVQHLRRNLEICKSSVPRPIRVLAKKYLLKKKP